MNLKEAEQLALFLVRAWGLEDEGWKFRFDNAKQRFGQCSYYSKTISLSRHLTKLNERDEVEDTILHEIAHAKAGGQAGHNFQWREWCRRVGAKPQRCYSSAKVASPAPNYLGYCPNCKRVTATRFRIKEETKRLACRACCRMYNGGFWSARFILQWVPNSDGVKPKPIPKKDIWAEMPSIEEL